MPGGGGKEEGMAKKPVQNRINEIVKDVFARGIADEMNRTAMSFKDLAKSCALRVGGEEVKPIDDIGFKKIGERIPGQK